VKNLKDIDKVIVDFIKTNTDEIVNIRREFHKIPELGLEELKTTKAIFDYLDSLGLKVNVGEGNTGVVAEINENIQDYCMAFRFDIDALPITEETGLPYSSTHAGRMHACGHDGHIAIGLGLAKLINEIKNYIPSRVRFIFQPAEEGLGGAKKMVAEGALQNPIPNLIVGLHIWPYLNSGEIGIKDGPVMAAGDKFYIKLIGKEGHGSTPHLAIDPTIMAAEIIQGLQNIVSRKINASESSVISVGTIRSGNSFNTVPSDVEITGTTRFTNMELREVLKRDMEKLIKGVTVSNDGRYVFNYEKCFDVTKSDMELVKILKSTISTTIGIGRIVELESPSMASEDFSEYENYIPGLYFFLGTKNKEKDCIYPLHNSRYNFDEDILPLAINLLARLAVNIRS
jgi:amidohydrolase